MAEERTLKEYSIPSSDEPCTIIVYPTVEAAGGALMNKDFTTAYALIEDMALNHFQWTEEKGIINSSPFEKEASMNEISSFDYLSTKVNALSQRLDHMNTCAVAPTSFLPPCEACGISSHFSIDCKLLSQVVHKVGYPNKMNIVTLRSGKPLKDPIWITKSNESEKEICEPPLRETRVEREEPRVEETTPDPFKPKIPFPQRFAKSKLDEQFKKFIEMMNNIYIDVPFTEVLTQMPTYAKFLKEILS
ncbi:hypothetical protein MTR_3g435880 [Medicago truncatula]|uniref:Uncharacterized protein n=1 Tax=Medicago truncatula TaxID=3880 RepID=A0A072UVD9_MEDTR|nr:hypothetical protein MTR_3g435880 [Medicago truncatula]